MNNFFHFYREDVNKVNQNSTTPSVAALRDFNGTNRSDTVSHLLKMSHRGYGSSSGQYNQRILSKNPSPAPFPSKSCAVKHSKSKSSTLNNKANVQTTGTFNPTTLKPKIPLRVSRKN